MLTKSSRQLLILSKIPEQPRFTSLNTIYSYLKGRGVCCSRRTLQRDFFEIEYSLQGFVIVEESRHNPFDKSLRVSIIGGKKPAFLDGIGGDASLPLS